jgi:hypothetical protein
MRRLRTDRCHVRKVWRFYLVWAEYPWVTAIPVSIFLANLGTSLLLHFFQFNATFSLCSFQRKPKLGVALRTFIPVEGFDELERRLDGVDICLSVGLNVLITILISVRLLRANKRLVKAFPLLKNTVHLNVISILVESAAPVAVFGIATVTASFIDTVEAAKAGAIIQVFYKVAAVGSQALDYLYEFSKHTLY